MISPDDSLLVDSHLQLFEEKPVLKSYVKTKEVTINPNDGWKEGNMIEFDVPKSENQLYESDGFSIHAIMYFSNGDGTKIDDTTQTYAPICGIPILAYEYITVQIGNTMICGENKADVYKHYIETLFGNSIEAKKTWLASSLLWYQDTAGSFDDTKTDGANKGFKSRYAIFSGGSKVLTSAKVPYPLAQTRKLLVPGISLKFILKRALDKFVIVTNSPQKLMKLNIEKVWMTARARSLEPPFYNSLVSRLQMKDASYNFIRTGMYGPVQLRTEPLSFDFTVFKDICPMTLFMFFVNVDAYQGSYSLTPLRTASEVKLKEAYVEVDGDKFPPNGYTIKTFSQDPNQAQVRPVFAELYRILQQQNGVDCGMTYADFVDGYTIYGFQISENLPSTSYVVDKRRGDTNLHFEFENAPDKAVNLFVLGTFDSTVYISATGGVIKNYTI